MPVVGIHIGCYANMLAMGTNITDGHTCPRILSMFKLLTILESIYFLSCILR